MFDGGGSSSTRHDYIVSTSHNTTPPDVWEFFSRGATLPFQIINRFSFTDAGPYVSNYDHVEVFNQNGAWKLAQIMDDEEQILDRQGGARMWTL
jgi:hypothetical protein